MTKTEEQLKREGFYEYKPGTWLNSKTDSFTDRIEVSGKGLWSTHSGGYQSETDRNRTEIINKSKR